MEEKCIAKNRNGLLLMFLGAAAIVLAVGLFSYNKWEEHQASLASDQALLQLQLAMEEEGLPADITKEFKNQPMAEIEIDGERYIGQLSIPELNLELPVISQWSYPKLKKSPCRYAGTLDEKNLVLLAHNYKSHFGKLHTLSAGAKIEFQDVNGKMQTYEAAVVETVVPTDVEKVTAGEYALTLFTCTYGGKYRTMVGCNVVDSE